ELGYGERDQSGTPAAQVAGAEVRPVPEFRDRLLHLDPDAFGDERVPVDDVRHGLDGYAGPVRDVLQANGHAPPPFPRCVTAVKCPARRPWEEPRDHLFTTLFQRCNFGSTR